MRSAADPISEHRGRLLGLAYRMLGSRADAEDVLQDAWIRLSKVDASTIDNVEAFLVTTVTRLCLDRMKSARAKREVYVGPWLPEPVVDTEELSPETTLEIADDLSFALMLSLERLSAPERAAFLLHDVFDTPYAEIAAALGKTEAACRQLATRARKAIQDVRPGHRAPPEAHAALVAKFAEAAGSGDASRLQALLAADAIATTDGGGVKRAALKPIYGADKVARLFTGLVHKLAASGHRPEYRCATINGEPGLVLYLDGELDQTLSIAIDEGRIAAIYTVRNPDKLRGVAERLH
jgi:RNA polymerase sigma-70 factor (ECF subfamily)